MIKIACVACLDPSLSVHTKDFLRATKLAVEYVLDGNFDVKLSDDRANIKTSAAIAKDIVAFAPSSIVGHYASSAAKAAIPIYSEHHLPLILPAATMSDLTRYPNVYRICDNDEDYCHWLFKALPFPIKEVLSDGSAHGESVVKHINAFAKIAKKKSSESAVIFSGSYHASVEFVTRHLEISTIILTDDAAAETLINDLSASGVDISKKHIRWLHLPSAKR